MRRALLVATRGRAAGAVSDTFLVFLLFTLSSCASLPDTHFEKHAFPKEAFVGDVKDRPYKALGLVKTRVDYQTLDANHEENDLCRNYYNKGARDLVKIAREKGADAVIDLKSVVFFEDGKSMTYPEPECSDDGQDGQILLQGIAVKWVHDTESKTSFEPLPETAAASQQAVQAPGLAPVPVKGARFLTPSTQRYRSIALDKAKDGIDGGIRVMSDPNRIVLFTKDRKILDTQNFEAKKRWFTAEYLRSPAERSILVSEEATAPAAGKVAEISTRLLDVHTGKLEVESWVDSSAGSADHLTLSSGPHSAWRLTDAEPHDLVQVSAQPEIGEVTFVRYHFAGAEKGWIKAMRAESGSWQAGQPFPAEERFPAIPHETAAPAN
jgi:hypothetical protein